MSSAITDDMIQQFMAITGVKETSRARFYVEAANGDLNVAVDRFLEDDANAPVSGEVVPQPNILSNTMGSLADGLRNHEDSDNDDDDDDEDYRPGRLGSAARNFDSAAAASKKTSERKPAAGAAGGAGRIFTLNNFSNEENEDDEEKGQAFYAGGSETSGQQILGPAKKKNPEKIIKNLFEKAREHGAEEVHESGATASRGPVVYGTGYRLGTGDEPTEVIQGPAKPKPPRVNKLKLWKNGFNVDDGPLRSYEDPQNREFLAAIQRGEPPRELIRQADGAEVHLDMEDHRDEEFNPPKPKYVLYNDGYKLGSPTPNVVSNASQTDKATSEQNAKRQLNTDESKQTTQLQVRLSDGTRLIIKANAAHRISDIRSYINTARPEYNGVNYSLMTSFPNKELTNVDDTLQAAGLLNAVIIQKLI